MFKTLLLIISIQASLLPKNEYAEDQILTKFIDALKDEKSIESWIKVSQRDDLYFYDLFKGITSKIRDVLVFIQAAKFAAIKLLIVSTNMILDKIGHPYFETFNIIESVKRIISINDNQNFLKNDTFDNDHFHKDFLYKEFDHIYRNLELTLIQVGHIVDPKKTLENYEEWKNSDHCRNLKPEFIDENLPSLMKFMELSNQMIESILPVNNNIKSYVEAHLDFKKSRKCSDSEIHLFIREKFSFVCPEKMLQYLKRCDSEQSHFNEIDIKSCMEKILICNKTTARVIIMIFHFYSEIKKRNTKYEIIKTEQNEYQIKWSLSKKASIEEIENFWMQQEIKDLSNKKIIHDFSISHKNNDIYSTSRSNFINYIKTVDYEDLKDLNPQKVPLVNEMKQFENEISEVEDEIKMLEIKIKKLENVKKDLIAKMKLHFENKVNPIPSKLFLFSCGHQIRFRQLGEFLKRGYTDHLKPLKCFYYCNDKPAYIVGWYLAEVYVINISLAKNNPLDLPCDLSDL